jgi:flagellar L-ring protein precursor FlgH
MSPGRAALMLCMLVWLTGCYAYSTRTTPIDREALRAPRPFPQQELPRYEGSLFIGENGRSLLFVDRKARQINDIITIRIVESAIASGEATTETERESSVSGSLEALFGFEKTLQNNGINPESVVSTSLSSGFDGSGTTARRNSLRATITAVVREVFPNGNLYIEGTKEVVINNERQYIIISGVIRPEDVQTDNSITSDLIADARVVYSGAGALADKQRPGLLGRLLDVVWPF